MSDSSSLQILLVEDNRADVFLTRFYLSQSTGEDYHLDTATSIKEAKEKLQLSKYQMIILDAILPDGDAIVLLNDMPVENANSMVVVNSGIDDKTEADRYINAGAFKYFTKSDNNFWQFLSIVNTLLERQESI